MFRSTHLVTATLALHLVSSGIAEARNGVLDTVLNRATQARNRAADARESANEIRDRVRDGAEMLTGPMLEFVNDNVEFMQVKIEGQAAFSSDACQDVRSQIVGLLEGVQYVADTTYALSSCDDRRTIDFEDEIAFIEGLPCAVLYPLATIELSDCLVDQIADAGDAMNLLFALRDDKQAIAAETLAQSDPDDPLAAFHAEMAGYRLYLDHYEAMKLAQVEVARLASALEFVVGKLKGLGETEVQASAGIHGYVHAGIKVNTAKKWASYVEPVVKEVRKFAEQMKTDMTRAVDLSAQAAHLDNQEEIIGNQELLLQAMQQQD